MTMAPRRSSASPASLFNCNILSSCAIVGLVLLAGFSRPVAADCECGYSATIDDDVQVFTDLIETDFAHLPNIATNSDWVRQAFNVTSDKDRGSYGEMYAIENMHTEADPDSHVENGQAKNGQPAGLGLIVKSSLVSGMVPVSEIDSNRTDVMYGSFRAGMKLTNVSGTCSAFFWVSKKPINLAEVPERHASVICGDVFVAYTLWGLLVFQRHAGNRHGVPI